MVTNGTPPTKPPPVLTLSRGGKVVASVSLAALVGMCCTQLPGPTEPEPPISPEPVPTVVVDAGREEGTTVAPCDFVPAAERGGKPPTRIVQGVPAPSTGERAFPFAVALADPLKRQYCGGSVYRDRWVLTAAHCRVEAGDYALVGDTYLGKARAVRVVEALFHPRYDDSTNDYDFSILRLESSAGVESVSLASGRLSNDATAVGWGRTTEGGQSTSHLLQVDVPLWDDRQCALRYPYLTSRMLCAGGRGTGDSCQGDSGGPLVVWNAMALPPRWEQIGVTSFGRGCDREGWPGVYAYLPAVAQQVDNCTVGE
jgi:secreted trypsin-like serine protease